MARTMDPVHVLYCDIADNSQSKYGSAFLVLEVLLHYRGPLEKLPTSLMLNSKQNWHLLTTIEWHHSERLSSAAQGAKSIIFQIRKNTTTFPFALAKQWTALLSLSFPFVIWWSLCWEHFFPLKKYKKHSRLIRLCVTFRLTTSCQGGRAVFALKDMIWSFLLCFMFCFLSKRFISQKLKTDSS